MSDLIKHVTEISFEADVLQHDKPVLVDFWTTWCGPCRAMMPLIDEIAEEYGDRLSVCKVDADKNRPVAAKCNVSAFPTLILFKDGAECGRLLGAVSKTRFAVFLDQHV